MIKVIIFDFDGTLFDTKLDIARSVNILLKENNLKELPNEEIYKNIGNGADVLISKSFGMLGVNPPKDSVEKFLKIYESEKLKNTKPFKDILDVIKKLHRKKSLYIITNKDEKNSCEILSYYHLEKYFKKVIGRDTFGIKKPDGKLIKIVKDYENVLDEEILIVGDSEVDINFGKNNNILVTLVTWGGMSHIESLKNLKPDFIVNSPYEILNLRGINFF
mgnify:CR=1 FL=1